MVLYYQMKAALRYMYYTRNMKIIFYFDPSCPFCWITSRWLLMVAEERDLQITWKPFSLAIKNEALEASADPHRAYHVASRRLLRVMLAAQEQNDESRSTARFASVGVFSRLLCHRATDPSSRAGKRLAPNVGASVFSQRRSYSAMVRGAILPRRSFR